MRQINLSNYTVRVRNAQGVARFKDEKCSECGSDLVIANPVNPKVQGPNSASGECPNCGQAQPLVVPDFLEPEYDMRDSLIELLLSKKNELRGTELLERDKLARKILDCPDGCALFEEEEWGKLVWSVNTVTGLGREDVEFVRRILEAEKIEVEPKK